MAQLTVPADGEVVTLMKVERTDGTVRYLRVADDETVEITKEQYDAEGGA